MDIADTLDAQVRRADPDRWLASRFVADETARADLIALYSFDHELARVPQVTHEPMMAEIRLTWWREGVDEIFAGKPARGHPTLSALGVAVARRNLAAGPLEAMIEARFAGIAREPFTDEAALEAYADGIAGAPLALALAILGHGDSSPLRPAALALILATLLGHDPSRLPPDWTVEMARERGLRALGSARMAARSVAVEAFPAVAHLTLVGSRLKGRAPGELESRARLTWATLTGRL
ncbi:MAG TPA: squalene/phytoene synthase family protein [Caulobacteraceae bacterium]|jgi:phytoene synthase